MTVSHNSYEISFNVKLSPSLVIFQSQLVTKLVILCAFSNFFFFIKLASSGKQCIYFDRDDWQVSEMIFGSTVILQKCVIRWSGVQDHFSSMLIDAGFVILQLIIGMCFSNTHSYLYSIIFVQFIGNSLSCVYQHSSTISVPHILPLKGDIIM